MRHHTAHPVLLTCATGLVLAGSVILCAGAQSAPAFEAASVKPNVSGTDNSMRNLGAGGRLVFVNYSLQQLITAAYDIETFQLIGGPAWMTSDRFDVTGTAGADTPLRELGLMLRSLLADRFKLVVHVEQRELPIYYLVKARNDGRLGAALRQTAVDCGPTGRGRPGCRAWISPTSVDFAGQSIQALANVLAMQLDRPVIDKTGLTGSYDLKLSFAPEGGRGVLIGPPPAGGAAPAAVSSDAPSLFTALQEQLGLRLESQRGAVDVVVVDSVERPTEN